MQFSRKTHFDQFLDRLSEIAQSIIDPSFVKVSAFCGINKVLRESHQEIQAQRLLAEAEEIAHLITNASEKANALRLISRTLAWAHEWKRAEEIAFSIDQVFNKGPALREIGEILLSKNQWVSLLPFLQRVWLSAETRSYALDVFPLASHLFQDYPSLSADLLDAFEWVDAFFKGERYKRFSNSSNTTTEKDTIRES